MNAVIYSRVSSRDQVEGTSLESQESACREYAKKHNLAVSRVFIEEGESAKYADRTQLLELMAYCKDRPRKVEVMLVWKVDRFARNVEDHYAIKAALRKLGVKVVSVTEPIESDATGKLMETILAGFAQFDNDIRALRSVQGMKQRLKEGIWPWKPPLGYLPPRIGKKTEPDRPDPKCFKAIQRAWQYMATGAYTKMDIVRLLRRWGVSSYRDRSLTPQSLDHIFTNRYYAGYIRDPWTGQEYRGKHEAMISEGIFARVQDVIHIRAKKVPHSRVNDDFPVRGLVRCPTCGEPMTGYFAQGKLRPYPYYKCFRRACPTRTTSYRTRDAHDQFERTLATSSMLPEASSALVAEIVDGCADRIENAKAAQKRQEALGRQRQSHLQELIAMRAERLISDDEFTQQRERLSRQSFKDQANDMSGEDMIFSAKDIRLLEDTLTDLNGTWWNMPTVAKQAFSRLILPDGFVFGGIRTPKKGLLFAVSEAWRKPQSTLVALIHTNLNTIVREVRQLLSIIKDARIAVKDAA